MAAKKRTVVPDAIEYEQWMRDVDAEVIARTGMSVHDLADVAFRDWYDDGITPAKAAARAIRNEMSGELE